jgi:hypothetical protein
MATASKGGALNQSVGRDQHHDEEASPGERRHGVKTHRAGGNGQLQEVSIPVR